MTKRRRSLLILTAIPAVLVVLFFVTANYSNDGRGVHYINRPPFASVSWGPSELYIVRDGINISWDNGMGAPGNVVEFPITTDKRISMRLFSVNWFRQEFRDWAANHERLARWLGIDPCPSRRLKAPSVFELPLDLPRLDPLTQKTGAAESFLPPRSGSQSFLTSAASEPA